MMRADIQRIFRGKGIYLTFIFLLITIFSLLYTDAMIMSLNVEDVEIAQVIQERAATEVNGVNATIKMIGGAQNLFFVLLPIMIFIAATDFSSGAVKNVLACGVSRVEYYFSKLILAGVFAFVVYSLYVLIPLIFATIIYGFGGTFDMDFVISVLKPFFAQLLIILAFISVVIFFIFVTKRTATVIGISIAFLSIPAMGIQALALINEKYESLFAYDLSTSINAFANIADFSTGDIIKSLLVGVAYILVSTITGILIFEKSEIK